MSASAKLEKAYAAVDASNAADPNLIHANGQNIPAALIYGQRMTAMLEKFQPDASDELKIEARGQHIERLSIPREAYPAGKAGY